MMINKRGERRNEWECSDKNAEDRAKRCMRMYRGKDGEIGRKEERKRAKGGSTRGGTEKKDLR